MIDGLKPYPKYRQSGLRWLAEIPSHWNLLRGKSIFLRIDERSTSGNEELLTVSSARGVIPRKTANVTMFKAESYRGYKLCWPGDLVINSLWAWAGGLGVSQNHGIISSAYGVYRLRDDAPARASFIHEIVRSSAFNWELHVRSKGIWTSRLQLTDESFLDAPFPLPPPEEQSAIVRFLDHANAKIERATRAKKKLIALLNEQKQAIIHHAVTCGLDPNVPLKPSGIPWLGNIPRQWQTLRLKWVTRLQRGYDLPRESRRPGSIPVVSSGGIIDTHSAARATAPGVVMGRYGSTEAVFYLDQDFWPHNTSLFVTDFNGNLPRWCFYLLRTISKGDHSSKSAVPGVDRKDLYDIYVALPPVEEQSRIVAEIESRLTALNEATQRAGCEIQLLREYGARLASDVVTGKLDVREASAKLSKESPPVPLMLDEEDPAEPELLEEESLA